MSIKCSKLQRNIQKVGYIQTLDAYKKVLEPLE